ncbi:MAG: hypothetical protein IJD92_05300 [Bacilli bacterium]|nr:hypothetical protein [Bacilli bacterium]
MNIEQNKLLENYIENDVRENLIILALDYEDKIDLNKIADYFIKIKDIFYICELICTSSEYLDLEKIFKKIIDTKDKTFIFFILTNESIKNVINEKYLMRLEKAIN